MMAIETPINQHSWPVRMPLPKDLNLDCDLRKEMLDFGAEYVWLDVICLRQQSEDNLEELKEKEWKLDFPMIGNIDPAAT